MKLKEAPSNKGNTYKEYYDSQVLPKSLKANVALAVYPEHITNKDYMLDKCSTEESYVKEISDLINSIEEVMAENSVIIISGYWGKDKTDNVVNSTWKSIMSAIKTTDYSIGDVIVWKKGFKTKNSRENRLDTICEPVFVLCRKEEYRTYNLNVEVQTVRGNAQYHTPQYNLITTTGSTVEDDYKQLKDYLIRMYCPDKGTIYNLFEEKPDVQDK